MSTAIKPRPNQRTLRINNAYVGYGINMQALDYASSIVIVAPNKQDLEAVIAQFYPGQIIDWSQVRRTVVTGPIQAWDDEEQPLADDRPTP